MQNKVWPWINFNKNKQNELDIQGQRKVIFIKTTKLETFTCSLPLINFDHPRKN